MNRGDRALGNDVLTVHLVIDIKKGAGNLQRPFFIQNFLLSLANTLDRNFLSSLDMQGIHSCWKEGKIDFSEVSFS